MMNRRPNAPPSSPWSSEQNHSCVNDSGYRSPAVDAELTSLVPALSATLSPSQDAEIIAPSALRAPICPASPAHP